MASILEDCVPNCPICVESFKVPKIFLCGHSLCLECLRNFVGNEKVKFKCPVCRTEIIIPENGIEAFPTNFALQNTIMKLEQVTQSGFDTTLGLDFTVEAATLAQFITEDSSINKHEIKCTNHNNRDVEFYCKDCEVGVCARCTSVEHKSHEYVDLDSESTRTDVIQQLTIREGIINQKIESLERRRSVLDDSCLELANNCDELCEQVTTFIKKHCEDNQTILIQNKTENQQVLDNLNTGIKNFMPSLTGDKTLALYEALHNLKILESSNNTPEVTSPVEYLLWEENSTHSDKDTVGSVKSVLLPITKRSNFRFDSTEITEIDCGYYSKDKVICYDVVWGCLVKRSNDGYCGIYTKPLKEDNPHLVSCEVKFNLTLMNKESHKHMTNASNGDKFVCGDNGWGWDVIKWKKLTDKTEGFVDLKGRFIVQLDITEIIEIKRDK